LRDFFISVRIPYHSLLKDSKKPEATKIGKGKSMHEAKKISSALKE
jgi:hypothetical protein